MGDEHPDVAFSLNNLATLLAATNHPESSLFHCIQASQINDKIIRNIFAFSSESDHLAFIEKLRGNFDLFLSLALVHKHLSNSENAWQAALDLVRVVFRTIRRSVAV